MILFAYHYHTSKHRRYAMPVPFQVEPLYLSKSVTHVGSSMEVRDNLRRNPYAAKSPSHTVHPHTGVRIETRELDAPQNLPRVHPHTGVRIETQPVGGLFHGLMFTPIRGCGLKHSVSSGKIREGSSPPYGGAD